MTTYTLSDDLTPGVVSAGATQALALGQDGTLWAWGANASGQLGDGTSTARWTPVMVHGLTGVLRSVSAGMAHSLAVRMDGTAWGWGANAYGKLGDGTTTPHTLPTQIPNFADVVAVAAGDNHSLALKADGTVWAWGYNYNGQLGDGTTTTRQSPVPVSGLTSIVSIAAGGTHSLAVDASGQVWAWGANGFSQLGDNTTTQRLVPTAIGGVANVVQVAAGRNHSLARTGTGDVYVWGANGNGQLGDGTTTTRRTPTLVTAVSDAVWIAGGASDSFAVTETGALWAWGANNMGQLGDGTTTQRTSPVLAPALPPVVRVSAGDSQTVALTEDSAVWTWGANNTGQLGNGTTTGSPQGAPIGGPDFTWGVMVPAFTPPPGTYGSPQAVALTTLTPGATIRYTTTGVEPSESDPVLGPGETVPVGRVLTLKAKAWKTGLTPSAVAVGDYVLQPAVPTATPGTGLYTTPQSVTLSTPTPGAAIRYTLDGTDPTGTSALYTGPLAVATGTVLQARAFKADWAASGALVAAYTFDYGTLDPPVASPPGGTYEAPQTVALTAAAGAAIRYTLDGTTPTEVSTLYSAPVLVSGTTTLQAKAFRVDWMPSLTLVEFYTVYDDEDATAPAITATVRPAPNAAGWNHTDVTVTFTCDDPESGITNCPPPVTVTTEGTGQVVSGQATNGVGLTATAGVTLNLDKTPPLLNLTAPPPQETEAGTVAVGGDASDELSGLGGVFCNGVPASVIEGVLACTLPLAPGANTILVDANDHAGNTTSTSGLTWYGTATAPATALLVTPSRVSLTVGDSRPFAATDNFHRLVDAAVWTSSDEYVATVSEGVVTAMAEGTATITVTAESLTASATVTVLAGPLPYGTVRWEADAQPGYTVDRLITGLPDELGSTNYVVESQTGGAAPTLSALDDDGIVKWHAALPMAPTESVTGGFGNSLGGVVLNVSEYLGDGVFSDSVLAVSADGSHAWRYRFEGRGAAHGQASNGVVFVHEVGPVGHDGYDSWMTLLDGTNGTLIARVPLAESYGERHTPYFHYVWLYQPIYRWATSGQRWTGGFGGRLSIDEEGTAHFFVSWEHLVERSPTVSIERALELWSVTSSGARTITPVAHYNHTAVFPDAPPAMFLSPFLGGAIVPTDDGDEIITWLERQDPLYVYDVECNCYNRETPDVDYTETPHVARRSGGVLLSETTLGEVVISSFGQAAVTAGVMGDGGTVFLEQDMGGLETGGVVTALDATSLTTKFSIPGGTIVSSTEHGGISVHTDNALAIYDDTGALLEQAPAANGGRLRGLDGWIVPYSGGVAEGRIPSIAWTPVGHLMPAGGPLENEAPQLVVHIYLDFTAGWDAGLGELSSTELASVREAARGAVEEAFQLYAVEASEGALAVRDKYHRLINVDGSGAAGKNGETTTGELVSHVHMGTLFGSFKSALNCSETEDCTATAFGEIPQKTGVPRQDLVTALGRGIGATGAHEVGHQDSVFVGVRPFTVHTTTCLNCYDYTLPENGVRYPRDYFFGPLKWSDDSQKALAKARWPLKR